ncbi:hypothetical protein ACHAO8_003891 [Botrytis cinerea]
MPGASLKGSLMAKGFNAAAARQTLKVQNKLCRLADERMGVESQTWANSIRHQKEKCLLLDLLPEVRLIIWEFCILNLPCGRKPITIEISRRQHNRDLHLFTRSISAKRPCLQKQAYFRQKFIDPVHPSFRAQMFNLLMICPQAYLEIKGGALLYKIKTFRFTDPLIICMVSAKIGRKLLFIQSIVLEYDIYSSESLDFVTTICPLMLSRSTFLKKFRMKLKILSRSIVIRATPGFTINGTLFPSHHPKVVHHKLCSDPRLWEWSRKPDKIDDIKDFDIDVSGDDAWHSYFRFGGDKNGWHLVRNVYAIQAIDMSELVQRLKERYPYYKKSGVKEQTTSRRGPILVDVCEPVFVTKTALDFIQEKNEKMESERVERKRLEERPEEQN